MIEINNNKFEDGDKITLFHDEYILHGEIYISGEKEYYLLHNDRTYYYDDVPIETEYKYAWYFKLSKEIEHMIYHHIEIERLFKYPSDHINKSVRNFLYAQFSNLYQLFNLKLGVIDNYDTLKNSDKQGFVELHSSKRNKKLSIKLGRLTRKIVEAFNEKIISNPKNKPFQFLDKDIEKLHNQWMSTHPSEIKYELLTGKDILKGYTYSNYAEGYGTLHNSCMTNEKLGEKYKSYLKLYTENPEQVSLLVFYDQEDPTKIAGRTLIWKCNDGLIYNDRIYYTKDWYEGAYQNVCKQLEYKDAYNTKDKISVTLNNISFKDYPYVDSFYTISFKRKTLYVNPPNEFKFKYQLRNTQGYIIEGYNNQINERDQH